MCLCKKGMAIIKSFRPPFSKGGGVEGRSPSSQSADCEILLLTKAQEREQNSPMDCFAVENPRRGFSMGVRGCDKPKDFLVKSEKRRGKVRKLYDKSGHNEE